MPEPLKWISRGHWECGRQSGSNPLGWFVANPSKCLRSLITNFGYDRQIMTTRRQFLFASVSTAAAWAARAPIKIAHREGNMLRQSSPGVYELAASIGGVSGIEVQTVRSNLWTRDTALAYKRESRRWGIPTVSMGGVMAQGASLVKPATAEESIRKAIAGAE